MAPLLGWIAANAKHVRVSSAVDLASDRSSGTCGADDRTTYATSNIRKGDVLVQLQEGAFLNGSSWLGGVDDAISPGLKDEVARMQPSGTVLGALGLLAEKSRGESSSFRGYIEQLPAKVPLPLTWTANSKALLQHTAACPIMDDGLVKSVYDRFALPLTMQFPNLWDKSGVSFKDFQWAFSIMSSRAFSVEGSPEPTLLPGIDMANHDSKNPSAEIRKDEDDGYSLVAQRDIPEGDAITVSYGDLSNAQLLCRYGFTLADVVASDSILISSTHVRIVFAQLTCGGSADAALAQLEQLDKESSVPAPATTDVASADGASSPSAKRRKLFDTDKSEDAISFALHGDAAQEFGLADGLMNFVFVENLPMDSLYDVLTVLLQHKDKGYSSLLTQYESSDDIDEETRLALALVSHERLVCRRILLGIMSLEEDSDDDDDDEAYGKQGGREDEDDGESEDDEDGDEDE